MNFRGPAWFVRTTAIVGNTATILALILLYLEYSGRLEFWDPALYLAVDTVLCGFMIAEWVILLSLVDDRRRYIKARWIDFLASLPLLLFLRPLRVVRLLRILRLLRGIALFSRALRPWEKALDITLLKTAALIASIVIVVSSLLIMDLERENPGLNTFGDAVWWSIVTATTVGYGDRVPETPGGQFIAVLLMILGIGLFGTLAATLTSALTATRKKKKTATIEDVMERLSAIEARLEEIAGSPGDR